MLRRERLHAAVAKCSFMKDTVLFLRYVVSEDGISMDESKMKAIGNSPQPNTMTKTRSFVGLAYFYRQYFISILLLHL